MDVLESATTHLMGTQNTAGGGGVMGQLFPKYRRPVFQTSPHKKAQSGRTRQSFVGRLWSAPVSQLRPKHAHHLVATTTHHHTRSLSRTRMHDPLHNTVLEFPNESSHRELSGELKARLESSYHDKDVEEMKLDSERLTARSASLRQQHIEAVKERAAREAQRVEEAATRKRRMAEAESRKLMEKLEANNRKHEAMLAEKQAKLDADKARRAALAEAAEANRFAKEVEILQTGVRMAEREKSALSRRDEQVEQVVKRNQEQVNHAMQVAAEQKVLKTERGEGNADGTDGAPPSSPHPSVSAPSATLPRTPTALPTLSEQPASTPRPSGQSPRKWTEQKSGGAEGDKEGGVGIKGLGLTVATPSKENQLRGEEMPKHRPHQMPTPRATESPRRPEMPTSALASAL